MKPTWIWAAVSSAIILTTGTVLAQSGFARRAFLPEAAIAAAFQKTGAEETMQEPIIPEPTPEELSELVAGNGLFAFDLVRALAAQQEGNLFCSPYSISEALAMTYGGARAETEQQMARVLHFSLAQDRLHPAFQALRTALTEAAQTSRRHRPEDGFRLHVANSVWVEQSYQLLPEFAGMLTRWYELSPQQVDFVNAAEQARHTINAWVAERTEQRVLELIPLGILDNLTRLVLVNAIYFKASWLNPFDEDRTRDRPFHLLDGSQVEVPMMRQTEPFRLVQGEGLGAIELPYLGGELAMVVVMPDEGRFEEIQGNMDRERFDRVVASMRRQDVALSLPRFRIESDFRLDQVLATLGMPIAFERTAADFSGMAHIPAADRRLYIAAVIHKAFVEVDERGTEAAAATAVVMAAEGAAMEAPPPPIPFVVDRPFLVFIRHNRSGAILFMGRVTNPSAP
ncbi:MAG: serpin family protein [Bradymonadales bacterium]|nr:serpin family protein [Bradymonadales bacterium]